MMTCYRLVDVLRPHPPPQIHLSCVCPSSKSHHRPQRESPPHTATKQPNSTEQNSNFEMSLLDTPLDVIETELPQSLPPLRGVASLRYSTSFEIQNALVNCAPCLLNDKETSVPPPAKSVLDLYKQLDKIFKSADAKDVQKAKVMEATSSWAKTASSDDWKRYLHWNEDHYTRNLIGATNEFEMLVSSGHPGRPSDGCVWLWNPILIWNPINLSAMFQTTKLLFISISIQSKTGHLLERQAKVAYSQPRRWVE